MPPKDITGDLAVDAAACGDLLAALRKRDGALAALRTLLADDESSLCHVETLGEGLIEYILKDVNKQGPRGATPLLVACLQGNVQDVEMLLRVGAEPTMEGDLWDTTCDEADSEQWKMFPLSLAARDGQVAIMKVLLQHNAVDVNQGASDSGCTALHLACGAGCLETVT